MNVVEDMTCVHNLFIVRKVLLFFGIKNFTLDTFNSRQNREFSWKHRTSLNKRLWQIQQFLLSLPFLFLSILVFVELAKTYMIGDDRPQKPNCRPCFLLYTKGEKNNIRFYCACHDQKIMQEISPYADVVIW